MSNKMRAFLVGVFILTAYAMLFAEATDSKWVTMGLDVFSGLSVIGIAVLLFPYFRPIRMRTALVYLILKFLEGGLMIAAGLLVLTDSLSYLRDDIYAGVQLYAFVMSGFVFYYLLLRSQIVPKFLSIWGLVAISVLFISTVLRLLGIESAILDMLLVLIITNEITLAFWLMIKGVKSNAK